MGLDKFRSQIIFLDTAPLIYYIEGTSVHQANLKTFFTSAENGEFSLVTSVLTLLEVLVMPFKLNRQDLVEQYKSILTSASGIDIIEMDTAIAIKAAEIRAKYNFKTPDSIQIGTALVNKANHFITNDTRLQIVKEIDIVTLSELS